MHSWYGIAPRECHTVFIWLINTWHPTVIHPKDLADTYEFGLVGGNKFTPSQIYALIYRNVADMTDKNNGHSAD